MSRVLLAFFGLLTIMFAFMATADAEAPYDVQELPFGYVTVIDEKGSVILQTGLAVHPGDQYINESNCLYEIMTVKGNIARGKYIRDENDAAYQPVSVPAQAQTGGGAIPIAIYHTHTDESYIPTDGKPTDPGNGSIMLVGDTFARSLSELGYQPIHDKTLHEPHDANAYQRSRRTFMKLLEQQPAALFDIHRDSAPLSAYKATIIGSCTTFGSFIRRRRSLISALQQNKSVPDHRSSQLERANPAFFS